MSTAQNRAKRAALRQQGRDDRDAGLGRGRYRPTKDWDDRHRDEGWQERDEEIRRSEVNSRMCVVTDAISEVEDGPTQEALYAIFEYVKEKLGE